MTTAGVESNISNDIKLLQRQSLKVEFHLDHTDYKRVENIGTGAYGVVCSAINKKTRQRVAIKKIPNLFTMDPRYAIRTYREIKVLQHFKHSNIIAIREILQPANKDITDIYVVMDLMESDLHRIIYSKQDLTDEHVKYFLYQILRGLKYIHSAHVIHRDLKPSNLLVNADCELKIGDFGMARGINFKAEKSNQQMTQYVATRWYRAPELIVASKQGYGAAIDMWSVGCIFAEMLRRKHLFPGRDLLNQLTMIFGTLGIPSKHYLDMLDSDTVCGFIRKVTESGDIKQKTYSELCPKASLEAIDLLSKMLVIEPEKRIDVEKAITHPFFSKYHDNTYEPNCSRIFDFTFEQELGNLQSDDQKRVKIQELLKKEVLSYRKPKPMDFEALITTSKSSDTNGHTDKSREDNPYADLSAFLAQMASPDKHQVDIKSSHSKVASSKPSANALLDAQKPTTQKTSNSLLQSQPRNSLLKESKPAHQNSLLNSQTNLSKSQNNPLLTQNNVLPFQKVKTNPLLAQPSSLTTKSNSVDTVPNDSDVKIINTTSESEQSNDTELFNSFLKGQVKQESVSDLLSVSTDTKASTDDIEMISAKLEQTEITASSEKTEVIAEKTEDAAESKTMDTKSLLRQRLMDRKNLGISSQVEKSTTGKTAVTAYQRQKEREERRKQRKNAKQKKKKKETNTFGQLLTSEDQKMLDRWTAMAKPQPIQPKPTLTTNTIVSTGGNSVIVVYPALPANTHTYIGSNISSTVGNTTTTVIRPQLPSHQPVSQIHVIQEGVQPQQRTVNTIPSVNTLINSSQSQRPPQSQPVRSFSDIAALHNQAEPFLDNGNDASLYDFNQFEPESSYTNGNGVQLSTASRDHSTFVSQGTNDLSNWNMSTSLDIGGIVKDEGLPPMLVSTPKGTGGGYGVGYDMETMLAYNPDMQNVHMDSAPLSASLLADWMDVTANMDPKTLEDIQHELQLSSALHDFPFNY